MNFEATVLKQLKLMSRLTAMPPAESLAGFLWLVAAHSFVVGILLVAQPPVLMALMGFGVIKQPFFPCQGGVFHVIMAIVYVYGALDVRKNRNMIIYAIIVKMAAAGFLFSYFYFMERLMVVFLSGVVDLGMGVIIWGLLVRITNDELRVKNDE
jgi:hypothetical protein